MDTTPNSTRDTVGEIFDKLAAEGSADPALEAQEPAGDAGGEPEPKAAAEQKISAVDRARDPAGRFAKGAKEPAASVQANGPALEADTAAGQGAVDGDSEKPLPAAPALPELKPPQDWRAAAKADWSKLPRAVQEEGLRLHGETRKTLDENAVLRKEVEPWKQAVGPYEHIFQRNGIPAAQAVSGLLRSFATLESGPTPARMQVAADIIRNYIGTDEAALTQLGQLLQAGGAAQPRPQTAPVGPDQVAELVRQQLASERATSARDAAVRAWQEFEPTADLLTEEGMRQDLADLAGKWSRDNPGQVPTKEVFQKLYERACALNERASVIVKQRAEAKAANAKRASTPASAAAASGLKNEPGGPAGNGKSKDTRDEVGRQYDRLTRSRV